MSWWSEYQKFRPGFIEAMADDVLYTIEFLDERLWNGAYQFWASDNAAIVTEVSDYPGGVRAVHVLWATGDMDEMRGQIAPKAEAWAKSVGCSRIIIEGRPGWLKVMKADGYRPFSVTLEKDI